MIYIPKILQIRIEELKKENEEFAKKLQTKAQEETTLLKASVNVNGDQHTTTMMENGDDVTTQSLPLPETENISDDSEPVTKLEKKFKESMEKVAELTDEKQKLEHLVLQLQGETETIGKLHALILFKSFSNNTISSKSIHQVFQK